MEQATIIFTILYWISLAVSAFIGWIYFRDLGDVSPVVRTLAKQQFDDYVKRVRIFVHPRIAESAREVSNLNELLEEAIASTGDA
jgi:hypothetical protein